MTSEFRTVDQNPAKSSDGRSKLSRWWRVQFQPAADNLTLCTQASVLENLRQLREKFKQKLEAINQAELLEDLQLEIPKIAVVVQRIERLVLATHQREKLCELNSLVCSIEIALSSLFQKKLSKEFARRIRLDVEREVIRHEHSFFVRPIVSQFVYVWHSPSTPLKVLYGLLWSFVIMFGGLSSLAILQYAIYNSNADARDTQAMLDQKNKKLEDIQTQIQKKENSLLLKLDDKPSIEPKSVTKEKLTNLRREEAKIQRQIEKLDLRLDIIQDHRNPIQKFLSNLLASGFSESFAQMLWVAAAGTLGSIVSILIRVIDGFQNQSYRDRLTPFFIGFFKPVIGASFGVLFLAFINSGVVTTPLLSSSTQSATSSSQTTSTSSADCKTMFFFAVAFVVGFSERLAKDTINKLDGTSQDDQKSLNQETQTKLVALLKELEELVPNRNQRSADADQVSEKSDEKA